MAFPQLSDVRVLGRHDPVAAADLVVCATSSADPIISAQNISPGTHVTLVGSYRPERREASGDLAT